MGTWMWAERLFWHRILRGIYSINWQPSWFFVRTALEVLRKFVRTFVRTDPFWGYFRGFLRKRKRLEIVEISSPLGLVGVPVFTPGPLPRLKSLALPARSRSNARCSKVHRTFSLRSRPLGFKSRFIQVNEKEERHLPFFFFMVGVPGFEPGASWSRRALETCYLALYIYIQ